MESGNRNLIVSFFIKIEKQSSMEIQYRTTPIKIQILYGVPFLLYYADRQPKGNNTVHNNSKFKFQFSHCNQIRTHVFEKGAVKISCTHY
jgi:hypothetical protein